MRLLIIAIALAHVTFAARILVFITFPMKSHHLAFQPIIRALAERGHHVTYFTTVAMDQPHPKNLKQVYVENNLDFKSLVPQGLADFGTWSVPKISQTFTVVGINSLENVFSHPEGRKLIESSEAFDLIIHEAVVANEGAVGLQHKFKALAVTFIPLADCSWVNEMAGFMDNPSYMIDFKSHFTDQMTFFQRLRNVYNLAATTWVSYNTLTQMQEVMDKHLNYTGWETRPPIKELLSDIALILVNSHHSVGYSYPKAPQVKELGGMNIQPESPLPKDLEELLNDSPQGVIYFSLGSNIDMSDESFGTILKAFMNVFSRVKQRVLWKCNAKKLPPVSSNVHLSSWFPQQGILAHKNVLLFISHGGMLSTTETVNCGVPIIGIPFFSDQRKNMNQVEAAGYGIRLDRHNLTEVSIMWAVKEILNNQNYKEKALKQQALFRDRPMTPVEEGVYWIEYILRHGNVLQPASVKMPFYKLYLLDVFAFIGAALIVTLVIILKGACLLFALCLSRIAKPAPRKKRQ